jgi:hypothetical protein
MFGWNKKKPTATYDDSLKTEAADFALTMLATTKWSEAPWHKKLKSAELGDETSYMNPRLAGIIARTELNRGMLQNLGIMRSDTGYADDNASTVVSTRQNIERLASLYRMIAGEPELLAKAARFMDVGDASVPQKKKLKLAASKLLEQADNLDYISKHARQPDGPAYETEPSWEMPPQLLAKMQGTTNAVPVAPVQAEVETPPAPEKSWTGQPDSPIQKRNINPDGLTKTDFDIHLG